MRYAFEFDPSEVLGIPADAPLAAIHEAYRAKSKKYHPDLGGDQWSFRVVSRCYEILSTARVMGRASEELRRDQARARRAASGPAEANPFDRVEPAEATGEGQVRVGYRDAAPDPVRLVGVEMLLLRFELGSPMELLTAAPEDRNLSCNLNITWPTTEVLAVIEPAEATKTVAALTAAFKAAGRAAKPTSSQTRTDDGRFVGWLSYPTAARADEAFKALRASLNARGLGVIQTVRDVVIPRDWGY